MSTATLLLTLTSLLGLVQGQTWCNKNYMSTEPIVPPGGNFPIPPTSSTPHLAFRCAPAIKPYLASDSSAPGAILIDATVTYSQVNGATPITMPSSSSPAPLSVSIAVNGKVLTTGSVPLNASKVALPFALNGLQAQKAAYTVECIATFGKKNYTTSTQLSYLPDPTNGESVTKMDLKTGALLAKPLNKPGQAAYEPVFPIGFYSNLDGYLASNLSVLDEMAALGYTVVHPIPTYDNLTALDLIFERMEKVGLYMMYDMRWIYTNTTAVTAQVHAYKNRPSLLLWYTADEPDGWGDALNATSLAYDAIYAEDGGYHPVSLVLNCQDYDFTTYASGADIVMADVYPIGNNVTFSNQWGTVCTPDYGDCGCDNCLGSLADISDRMDQFKERFFVNGWEMSKAIWTVPQGFGNDTYWTRYPTGKEWVVQSVVAINHGALGVISWNAPSTSDIQGSASILAKALPSMTPFFFSHDAQFSSYQTHAANGSVVVDVGMWTVDGKTLVLATNLQYAPVKTTLTATGKVTQVLDSGASAAGGSMVFEAVGTGAWIVQ